MTDKNKDISSQKSNIDQHKLMQYINDSMSHENRNDIEREMEDDPFVNDAIDGLQEVNKEQLPILINEINLHLFKEVSKKKKRKRKSTIANQNLTYIAVILILLLLIITYLIYSRMK
jgi:hypothetical protein